MRMAAAGIRLERIAEDPVGIRSESSDGGLCPAFSRQRTGKALLTLQYGMGAGEAQRGKERLRDEIVSAFAAEGLSDAVTWIGQRSDLREIMASTDVTVSPSLQPEAFGKTVLEAIALGRPVAGYAHGGVAEILGTLLPEGRVQPRDTDALAALLTAWHSSPPKPRPVGAPFRMADMIAAHIAAYSG